MKQFLVWLVVLSFVLSACASGSAAEKTSSIEVSNAWVRTVGGMQPAEGSGPAGMKPKEDAGPATGMFMILKNNGSADDKLIKAESDVAKMVQIHLTEIDANGVSSMHEVDGVDIPAGGSAELKPGSYHVMLIGLKQELKEGDLVTVTLTFQNGGQIVVEAPVKTP